MPLQLKTLREVSARLGMPEAEIRALVQMNKVRAVFKKTGLMFAPDEIAKIERQRKSLPESALKASAVETAAQFPAPAASPSPSPKKAPPPRKPAVKVPTVSTRPGVLPIPGATSKPGVQPKPKVGEN
jgi:hypothetical protein